MRTAICRAAIVAVAIIAAGYVASAADGRPDQWTLAQENRSVHRFSTSVKAQEMQALFRNDETLTDHAQSDRESGQGLHGPEEPATPAAPLRAPGDSGDRAGLDLIRLPEPDFQVGDPTERGY